MNRDSFWYKLSCVFFPERCAVCDEVISPGDRYCAVCRKAKLHVPEPRCLYCGGGKQDCVCRRRKRAYDSVVSVLYYEGRVREYFPRFKRRERYGAAQTFAEEMAVLVRKQEWQPQVITFVPSHTETMRERGFNPAELLAIELGRELSLPVKPLLKKIYNTQPQKELPTVARSGNLLGAFDVTEPVDKLACVLLVDDVTTTGGTLDECAKMLKIYGVETVYAVTACFTVRRKPDATEKPLVKAGRM